MKLLNFRRWWQTIDMGTVHLAKGSKIPPREEGKLRLYSMKFCPYVQRVRLVLLAKNVSHDIVNVNLQNKPDWIWELHPEGKVPVLDTGSEIIPESLNICNYLEEKYPNPPLYPKDTQQLLADKELIQIFGENIRIFLRVVLNRKGKRLAEYASDFMPLLKRFDQELSRRGQYFGGNFPGMVDYMIWPWAERIPVLNYIYIEKFNIPDGYFTHLKSWYFLMLKSDTVIPTVLDIQQHYKFISQFESSGPIDYDNI